MQTDCECSKNRVCASCLERSILRKMAARGEIVSNAESGKANIPDARVKLSPPDPTLDRFVREDPDIERYLVQPRRPAR